MHLASGAIGGFDVLQTVTLMAEAQKLAETAGIETHTGAKASATRRYGPTTCSPIRKRPLCSQAMPSRPLPPSPRRVNVAVATSLATTGPEITGVTMHSVPRLGG